MRVLPLLVAALFAVLTASPVPSQAQTAEQEFSRLSADRAHRLGVQQYRIQNYELALRQFEKAVALAPDVEVYRHSLALTKQRIAIIKANQRRLQDTLNRARKSMDADAAPEAPSIEDEIERELKPPVDSTGMPGRGRDAQRTQRQFDQTPAFPGADIRDANRDLGLGGSRESLGQPFDLPITGSDAFDLPVGWMPPELNKSLRVRPDPSAPSPAAEAPVPTSGEGSMFPFLDPPADPAPVRARGRTPSAADGPNLDTPGTLP